MNAIQRIAAFATLVLLAACTTTTDRQYEACIAGFTAIGGSVAGASSGGSAVLPGMAAGAATSAVLCAPPPSDSDGDGVVDDKDACPGTPTGVAVDERGCPLDSDGDGVSNDKDACPGTPAGVAVDGRGCPLDSDGDGVTDDKDRCPGTPAGVKVDKQGCPMSKEVLLSIERFGFAFDSAELDADARAALDAAVEVIKAGNGAKLDVIGHTDSTGPEGYNQRLSERRAQAAVDYLVSKGVDASQLRAVGRGEAEPITGNDTRDGRARNRRVELVVR